MKHLPRTKLFLALATLVCLGPACDSSTKGNVASDALAPADATGVAVSDTAPDASNRDAGAPDLAAPKPDAGPDLAAPKPDAGPDLAAPKPDTAGPDLAAFGPDASPDLATPKPDTASPDLNTPRPDTAPDLATPKPDTAAPDLATPDAASPDVTAASDSAPPRFDALAARCILDGASPSLVHLSPLELKTLLDAGEDVFLINVKGASIGQIPGTDATLTDGTAGIEALVGGDSCANIVLYCQGGSSSQSVGTQLIGKGYRRVRDLSGGITAWKAAGYPTL